MSENRAAFVHVREKDHWRVYEALFLKATYRPEMLAPHKAWLVYLDDGEAQHHIETEEIRNRISAGCYVMAPDFELLARSVEADYAHRSLWREAFNDIQRLRGRQAAEGAKLNPREQP